MGQFFSPISNNVFKPQFATATAVNQVQGTDIANTLGGVLESIANQKKIQADTDKLIQDMAFNDYKLPLQLEAASIENQTAQENLNILKKYGDSTAKVNLDQLIANVKHTNANTKNVNAKTANEYLNYRTNKFALDYDIEHKLNNDYAKAVSNIAVRKLDGISNPSSQNIYDAFTLAAQEAWKDKNYNKLSSYDVQRAVNLLVKEFSNTGIAPYGGGTPFHGPTPGSVLGGIGGSSNGDNSHNQSITNTSVNSNANLNVSPNVNSSVNSNGSTNIPSSGSTNVDEALNKVIGEPKDTNSSTSSVPKKVSEILGQNNSSLNKPEYKVSNTQTNATLAKENLSKKEIDNLQKAFINSGTGIELVDFLNDNNSLGRSQKEAIFNEAFKVAVTHEKLLRKTYDEAMGDAKSRLVLSSAGITNYDDFVKKSGYPSVQEVMGDSVNQAIKTAQQSSNNPLVKVQSVRDGLLSADKVTDNELNDLDTKTLYQIQGDLNIAKGNGSITKEQLALSNRIDAAVVKRDKEVVNPALNKGIKVFKDNWRYARNKEKAEEIALEIIAKNQKMADKMNEYKNIYSNLIDKVVDKYAKEYSNIGERDKEVIKDMLQSTDQEFKTKMKRYGLTKEQQKDMVSLRDEVTRIDSEARARTVGNNIARIKDFESKSKIKSDKHIDWSTYGQLTNKTKNDFRYGMLVFQNMSETEVEALLQKGGEEGYEFIKELIECSTRSDVKDLLTSYQDTINGSINSTATIDFKNKALLTADAFQEMIKENPNNIGYFVSGKSTAVRYTPLDNSKEQSAIPVYGVNVLRMDPNLYMALNDSMNKKIHEETRVLREYIRVMNQTGKVRVPPSRTKAISIGLATGDGFTNPSSEEF